MIQDRERTEKEIACDNAVKEGAVAGAIGGARGGLAGAASGAGLAAIATVVINDNCANLV